MLVELFLLFLLFLGCCGTPMFLILAMGIGYYVLSRKKGKNLKDIKPREAVTAAFVIGKGGLAALMDEDDEDEDEDEA
jgi:hypothetical protein